MKPILHYQSTFNPLAVNRLVFDGTETPTLPPTTEIAEPKVESTLLKVVLPSDLEDDLNTKLEGHISSLNTQLDNLGSVNNQNISPERRAVILKIKNEIINKAKTELGKIQDKFKQDVRTEGVGNQAKIEKMKDNFANEVEKKIADLISQYRDETERKFLIDKKQLSEAQPQAKLEIKKKMFDELTGLDEWSQAINEEVKNALKDFVVARIPDSIFNSSPHEDFAAKVKELMDKPEFWRNVLSDFQKDLPKIKNEPLEEQTIGEIINKNEELKIIVGEKNLRDVKKAIAQQLHIIFGKNDSGQTVSIGYVDMVRDPQTLITDVDGINSLESRIDNIIRVDILGGEGTDAFIKNRDGLAKNNEKRVAEITDTIGDYTGHGASELDELASVVTDNATFREKMKTLKPALDIPGAGQLVASIESNPDSGKAAEIVKSAISKSQESMPNNPFKGNVLIELLKLIGEILSNPNINKLTAFGEIMEDLNTGKNTALELNKSKEKYSKLFKGAAMADLLKIYGEPLTPANYSGVATEYNQSKKAEEQILAPTAIRTIEQPAIQSIVLSELKTQLGLPKEATISIQTDTASGTRSIAFIKDNFKYEIQPAAEGKFKLTKTGTAEGATPEQPTVYEDLIKLKVAIGSAQPTPEIVAKVDTEKTFHLNALDSLIDQHEADPKTLPKTPLAKIVDMAKDLKEKPDWKKFKSQKTLDEDRVKFITKNYDSTYKNILTKIASEKKDSPFKTALNTIQSKKLVAGLPLEPVSPETTTAATTPQAGPTAAPAAPSAAPTPAPEPTPPAAPSATASATPPPAPAVQAEVTTPVTPTVPENVTQNTEKIKEKVATLMQKIPNKTLEFSYTSGTRKPNDNGSAKAIALQINQLTDLNLNYNDVIKAGVLSIAVVSLNLEPKKIDVVLDLTLNENRSKVQAMLQSKIQA